MRTLFNHTDPLRAHRRRAFVTAAFLLAALCVAALMLSSTAPAASLEEKRDATQSKLNEVEANDAWFGDAVSCVLECRGFERVDDVGTYVDEHVHDEHEFSGAGTVPKVDAKTLRWSVEGLRSSGPAVV